MAVPESRAEPRDAGQTCISLVKIGKHYGKTKVLDDINLEIKSDEFCVFVGPSGCGKSTLLRMIAGLETITTGDLFIDGKRMNEVEPSKRGIAMVFQSYALYPHMTVYDNMAFGLSLGKLPKSESDRRIREAARMLKIEPLLQRLPKELSGGQRQRVAIGRAITRHAKIFLFDEPLSNLDAALRVSMRSELSRLRKQLQTTMVYVTHDQVEAMTMADRLVVLHAGHIEQVGPPLEVYHRPRTLFAAGFLGSPRMNFLRGEVTAAGSAGVTVKLADGTTVVAPVSSEGVTTGQAVTLGIRPEHLRVTAGAGANQATVQLVEDLGDHSIVHLESTASDVRVLAKLEAAPAGEGEKVAFEIPPEECHVFDSNERALARLDRRA
ncbi:MAG TPA: sn-glycerol-3-phosphate ABC transporter ATP-binding protein UgpC [Kofleriaceae bacterium]|nr:sn-glycerol-3-phosphate ABC transporter ATP-binding protein UgpC [Kofleriaceae bacterium]